MIDELTLLHAAHRPRCIASVDKIINYHTLQLMTRGQVELFYDDTRHLMENQWLWPCYPGPVIRFHEFPRGRSWNHRYIAFSGPLVRRWEAAGIMPVQPLRLNEKRASDLALRFDRMLSQMNRPGRWGQAHAVNLLESILLDIAEKQNTVQVKPPAWLREVIDILSKPENKPDYRAIARQVHLSLPTLRRHFKQATGIPLHQYRLDMLITEARRQLGNTDKPIKQISDDLGYQDVYYFTRQFTQTVGISPARFRRSRQM